MTESTQEMKIHVSRKADHPSRLPSFLSEALFSHAADGFVLMDAKRTIIYMNPAAIELTGYSNGCGVHCGLLFQCHSDTEATLHQEHCFGNHVLLTEKPLDTEMNLVTKSGETVTVAVTYSHIPAEDGRNYLLMSIRNISDRKRLDKERRQKDALHYTLQERERLARDLHDGVVQDIAYANMQMKLLLEETEAGKPADPSLLLRLSKVLDESYVELRQALYDLTFRVKEDLASYVRNYLQEYEVRNGLQVEFQMTGKPAELDADISSQVAKLLQEALSNIRKHAKADRVSVTLSYAPGAETIRLIIEDNGQGFDVQAQVQSGHYGMKTMRERCRLLGGSLTVESSPGNGTSLYIEVPSV